MASVKDYLKKLLYQYDCVVVPELGAFLTHYQPASFTESSGLFLPPRKRVAFNEALRLDDGILANYIMLHEPVTREGAQRYISQFVSKLRQEIAATGRFELDGIGTFTANEENRLQFDPSLRHNFYGDAYGMSAISAQSLVTESIEAVVSLPSSTAVGPVLVQEEATLLPMPRSRPQYWRVAAAAILVGSLGFFSYFSVIKPGQPLQSSLDPAMLLRVPATLFERTTPAAKPAETPVKSVTVAPVTPPVAEPAPAVVATPAVKPVAPSPTIAKPAVDPKPAPVAASAPARKPAEAVVATVSPRTTPYFTIIAGSFSSKRNALKLKRQLTKAGYTDAFVIAPSRKGQLFKVAAAGADSREEALMGIEPISKIARTSPWIYKN